MTKTYVNWRGQRVEIPTKGYEPAGEPKEYTQTKIASTLDFYHRQLLEGDIHEALTEEKEERHHPSLLNTAILRAINDTKDQKKLNRKIGLLLARTSFLNQNP